MIIPQSVIREILDSGAKLADFSLTFPDGKTYKAGKRKDEFHLLIKSSEMFTAMITKGGLGVGEQFMLGNWDIEGNFDKGLTTMLFLYCQDTNLIKEDILHKLIKKGKGILFPETKNKALKDISAHYDLSNDFYSKFLDPTMTYSCAYFKKETDSLETAQNQKYEHICRKLDLEKGETLLDVGCGWGGMLIYAAQKYGVKGYGVTLSKNQLEYATAKVKQLKLDKQIKMELKDYRDINGTFDKFVSIGMFEHVTRKYYDEYFSVVKKVLKPGSLGALHTIGTNEEGLGMDMWFQTYIFPGAQIPALERIVHSMGQNNLYVQDVENLRLHYAKTLLFWAKNYEKIYHQTIKDRREKFAKMWKYYLYLSRASFLTNISQLWQVTFVNGTNNDLPLTRERLYR